MRWTAADIAIFLDDDGTDDPVMTASVQTPTGSLLVMAEPGWKGDRCLVLDGLHLHADGVGADHFGTARLRQLVQAVMELWDLDEIVIRGATRTTGAAPGRRPGEQRFARKVEP